MPADPLVSLFMRTVPEMADELVDEMLLSRAFLQESASHGDSLPVVRVLHLRNDTSLFLQEAGLDALPNRIGDRLAGTRRVRVVPATDPAARTHTEGASRPPADDSPSDDLRPVSPNYVLYGGCSQVQGRDAPAFLLSLTLASLRTGCVVWTGERHFATSRPEPSASATPAAGAGTRGAHADGLDLNLSDFRHLSEKMVDEMLESPILAANLAAFQGGSAMIQIDPVRNRTYQMGLDLDVLVTLLRRRLFQTARFRLAADSQIMQFVLRDSLSRSGQISAQGSLNVADYTLHGSLSERREPGWRDYTLTMVLENRHTGEADWRGETVIRKMVAVRDVGDR